MIIIVNINQSYKRGLNIKFAAHKSWALGSLLSDPAARNRYKFLVAQAFGKVVGTFCIHGVALDSASTSTRKMVKFLLAETSPDCDKMLRDIIETLKLAGSPKLKNIMHARFLDEGAVRMHTDLQRKECECMLEEIPLIDETRIEFDDYDIEASSAPGINAWLRLQVKYNTWDSFRNPASVNYESHALLDPSGAVGFVLKDNTSGTFKVVRSKLGQSERIGLIRILKIFFNDSARANRMIDLSAIHKHVAHYNGLEINFDAFSDAGLTKLIQHSDWKGNVMFVQSGFLKEIMDVML